MHRIEVCGMGQEGTTLDGEAAALIEGGCSGSCGVSLSPQWLVDLKATAEDMRQGRERPPGKPFGRWLGDFLDQDTPSGLLPAEEKVLFAAAKGEACVLESRAVFLWAAFDAWREKRPEAPAEELGFVEAIAKYTEAAPEAVQEVIIEATRYAIEKFTAPCVLGAEERGRCGKVCIGAARVSCAAGGGGAPRANCGICEKGRAFFSPCGRVRHRVADAEAL